MTNIELVHLVATGPDAQPASIDFASGLTLIHGPSNTGKSFIVSALDFMLGAAKTLQPVQLKNYSHLLLALRANGEEHTLSRPVGGGSFIRHHGLHKRIPDEPGYVLTPKHGPGPENISAWLLSACGLTDVKLKKNARNETVALSFRDMAHLTLIDETKMQSRESPPHSGQYTTRTKETSALKLLLEGEDDSDLIAEPQPKDARKLRSARVEVLDELLQRAEEQIDTHASRDDLEAQLARIEESVNSMGFAEAESFEGQQRLRDEIQRESRRARAYELRQTEISALQARFGLLRAQYNLDMQRLDAILEGGSLLGYFSDGVCALCGAEQEHQRRSDFHSDPIALREAVRAEQTRIQNLTSELDATLEDLGAHKSRVSIRAGEVERRTLELREKTSVWIQQRTSGRSELRLLVDAKSRVERKLAAHTLRAELIALRAHLMEEKAAEIEARAAAIPLPIVDEFSRAIADRLIAWGYPADDVRYDRERQDVWASGQYRADHGKGVRSLLQAAFSVGLADYCIRRGLPHPGFVILDSPLITYRAPDFQDWPDASTKTVAARMYEDLESTFEGQIILMENTEADGGLQPATGDTAFSATPLGRYGFFPADVKGAHE